MSTLYYESSFAHHGIKGQKWGVRRYQNPDGSLTAKGKSRYDDINDKKAKRRQESYERGKKLAEEGATLSRISDKMSDYNKKKGLPRLLLAQLGALGFTAAGIAATVATPAAACVTIPITVAGFLGIPLGAQAINMKNVMPYAKDANDLNEFLGERRRQYDKKADANSVISTTRGKYAYDNMPDIKNLSIKDIDNLMKEHSSN